MRSRRLPSPRRSRRRSWTGSRKPRRTRTFRGRSCGCAGPFHERKAGGVDRGEILAEHEDERGEEDEHGHRVEQPLEDDRRERAGRRHASLLIGRRLAREEIGANDLAGAGRQHAARGKPDRRGAKRIHEARVAERRQQVLPAQRADRQIHQHRRQGQHQPFGARVDNGGQDATEIDVVKEQRDQGDGAVTNTNILSRKSAVASPVASLSRESRSPQSSVSSLQSPIVGRRSSVGSRRPCILSSNV